MSDGGHGIAAPLARDEYGTPFPVPSAATCWRVRRHDGRPGRPKAVWTDTGILHLELSADRDRLRRAVENRAGVYRLYLCDRFGTEMEPVAVVELVEDEP